MELKDERSPYIPVPSRAAAVRRARGEGVA